MKRGKRNRIKYIIRILMKFIILIFSFISIIIVIGEPEELTMKIIFLKIISMFYLWLVLKSNNYFNER